MQNVNNVSQCSSTFFNLQDIARRFRFRVPQDRRHGGGEDAAGRPRDEGRDGDLLPDAALTARLLVDYITSIP